jgi:putative oxidoreductase
MERILGRFTPQIYALMRIVVAVLFACHGAQKLLGVLGGTQVR